MKTLDRRAVLRGALGGAILALALPSLEVMFGKNGEVFADGSALPTFFGVWWWGCGARLDRWIPHGTGQNYPLSEELMPFSAVKDYVSVVSGTRDPFGGTLGHHDGWVRMMTGSDETFDGRHGNGGVRDGDGPFIQPSLDQIVAAQWKGKTTFDSIQAIVSQRGAASGPDYCVGISQQGQDKGGVLPGTPNPLDLFKLLLSGAQQDQTAKALAQAQGNVLGGFLEDAKALKRKLGSTDQKRLDQYLSTVNDLDARLKTAAAPWPIRTPPSTANTDLGHEDLQGRGRLLVDVLALALACDRSRVFSLEFSPMQAMTIYYELASFSAQWAAEGYHDGASHNDQEFVHQATIFNMGELAYLLQALKSTTHGNGVSLLDSSCIYASTDVAEPDSHDTSNMPILVMGKANGGLLGGVHYASNGEPPTAVHLTMFQAIGLPMAQFGYHASLTSNSIAALRP
jgi:hypothetical protein